MLPSSSPVVKAQNEPFMCEGLVATIVGIAGADGPQGTWQDDVMVGFDGIDTVNGASQNDTVQGGDGDDTINGDSGDDALDGGNGFNVVDGSWGTDTGDDAETTPGRSVSCPRTSISDQCGWQ